MGNKQSTVTHFGTVHPVEGSKGRPGYYFNKSSVIYQGIPIQILPNESDFKKLNYGYLKSNLRVFYNGAPIYGANPKTFHILQRKDSPMEFKHLNSVLGKDYQDNKERLYHFGKLIYTE
jgi:hypothetical protein